MTYSYLSLRFPPLISMSLWNRDKPPWLTINLRKLEIFKTRVDKKLSSHRNLSYKKQKEKERKDFLVRFLKNTQEMETVRIQMKNSFFFKTNTIFKIYQFIFFPSDISFRKSILLRNLLLWRDITRQKSTQMSQLISLTYLEALLRYDLSFLNSPPPPPPYFDRARTKRQ